MADEDALRKIRAVEEQIEYLQKKLAMAKQVGTLSLFNQLLKSVLSDRYVIDSDIGSFISVFFKIFFSPVYVCLFNIEVFYPAVSLFCVFVRHEVYFQMDSMLFRHCVLRDLSFLFWSGIRGYNEYKIKMKDRKFYIRCACKYMKLRKKMCPKQVINKYPVC